MSDNQILEQIVDKIIDHLDEGSNRDEKKKIVMDFLKQDSVDPDNPIALHNSKIDVMVAWLNYIAQSKKYGTAIAKTASSFDMETIPDMFGNATPYQMTMLTHRTTDTGELKVSLYNVFINNATFFDVQMDDKGKPLIDRITNRDIPNDELKRFYAQQRRILGKLYPNKTEDELNQITYEQIQKIKNIKNDVSKIIPFINTLLAPPNKDHQIITHFGDKFDLPVFINFLENYASRILPNIYYQEMKSQLNKNYEEQVEQRFTESGLAELSELQYSQEIIKEYRDEHQRFLAKAQDPDSVLSDEEIRAWDALTKKIYLAQISADITNLEIKQGIIFDEDLKRQLFTDPDSVVAKLQHKIFEFVELDSVSGKQRRATIVAEITAQFTKAFGRTLTLEESNKLSEFVTTMINNIETDYKNVLNNRNLLEDTPGTHETLKSKVLTKAKKEIKSEENQENFMGSIISSKIEEAKALREVIKFLQKTNLTPQDIVSYYEHQESELNLAIDELKGNLDTLKKTVANKNEGINTLLIGISQLAERLHNKLKHQKYLATTAITTYKQQTIEQMQARISMQFSTGLQRRAVQSAFDELLKTVSTIQQLITDIVSSATLENKTIEQKLMELGYQGAALKVHTEAERLDLLATYKAQETKLIDLSNSIYDQDKTKDGTLAKSLSDILNKIKLRYRDEITKTLYTLNQYLNNPEFKKLIEEQNTPDLLYRCRYYRSALRSF